jgi:hypothetical protein
MSVKVLIEVRINVRSIVSVLIVVGCVSPVESETVPHSETDSVPRIVRHNDVAQAVL